MIRVATLAFLGMLCLLTEARAQRYGMAPRNNPDREEPPEVQMIQRLGEPLPLDVTFQNELDQPVELGEYIGNRPTILVLTYFECPMLCTEVLNGLIRALRDPAFQREIGEDFNIVTVSFDPKDSPPAAYKKKHNYVASYGAVGAEENWHFLTGEQESIDALTEAVGFRYEYDKQRKEYYHDSAIMVITPSGKLSRYFFGTVFDPGDLDKAMLDSSEGTVGSLIEREFVHLCFYYDERSGSYQIAMRTLGIAAGITVLILGLMLIRVIRRARVYASEVYEREQQTSAST